MQRNRLRRDGRRRPAPRTPPLRSGTPAIPGAGGGPGVEGAADGTIPNAAPARGRGPFRIETARHRAFLPSGLVAAGLLASAPAGAIVGGQPTDPDEYRWQVLVFAETGNRETDRIGFCGGTLIARDWVMTAAHCLDRSDGLYVDGRGPAFSVTPGWGEAEGETASMWSGGPWPESARAREHRGWIPSGTRVRMDHWLDFRGNRVLMKPYAEAYLKGESVERMRIGTKMEALLRPGERMTLETSVEGVGGVEPDRVMLRGRLDF